MITVLFQIIKLYERCLIACANYPEFWIRYVLYMEFSGNVELAYNALTRATHVFVKVFSFFNFPLPLLILGCMSNVFGFWLLNKIIQ